MNPLDQVELDLKEVNLYQDSSLPYDENDTKRFQTIEHMNSSLDIQALEHSKSKDSQINASQSLLPKSRYFAQSARGEQKPKFEDFLHSVKKNFIIKIVCQIQRIFSIS